MLLMNDILIGVVWLLLALECSCSVLHRSGFEGRYGTMTTTPNLPKSEMQALQDLYDSTQGDSWHWKTDSIQVPWNFSDPNADPCTDHWQGVSCSYDGDEYTYVLYLDLSRYNLIGTLPDSLNQLTRLANLSLCDNSLVGTIPETLGNLTDMVTLQLCNNALAGTLPSALQYLTQLTEISFGSNLLVGTIPDSFGLLAELKVLALGSNKLTGPIPAAVSNLSQLQVFNVQDNFLNGSLPAYLGNLSMLIDLDVATNGLTGPVPSSLNKLTQLVYLGVAANKLTGSIPDTLGSLEQLIVFSMENNQLSGPVPDSLGGYSRLQRLTLFNNRLQGFIPTSLGNLSHLLYLDVHTNELTGTVPESLANLNRLQVFAIENNHLTGTLPDMLDNYPHLQYLAVSNNSLTGTVPASVGELGRLFEFSADHNCFTGSIPSSVAHMAALNSFLIDHNRISGSLDGVFDAAVQTGLITIVVNNNRLTGTIPSSIFNLPALNTVVASTNCFHGQLPDNICACTSLVSVVLDGLSSAPACKNTLLPGLSHSYSLRNSVHGTIPTCLFQLPTLVMLHLSGNGFMGSVITDSTAVSPGLLDLSLSHNVLTGTIPAQLQNRTWALLDLSFNRLRGSLSNYLAARVIRFNASNAASEGAKMSLSLENNRLSGPVPRSVQKLRNVSILAANTFSCKLDGSDLPQHDSGVSNYQCGSSEFDVPYYVWLGLCCLSVVLLCCAVRFRYTLQQYADVNVAINCCYQWWDCVATCGKSTTSGSDLNARNSELYRFRHIRCYSQVLDEVNKHAVVWTAVILVVLLPLYAALSHYYGTHLQAYAWTVSAAYLSGAAPFSLEMVLWLILLCLAMVSMLSFRASNCPTVRSSKPLPDAFIVGGGAKNVTNQQVALIYMLFLGLNLLIVGGVNVAYVYVSIYRSSQLLIFAQICMSFFKVIYNGIASTRILRYIVMKMTGEELQTTGYASLRVFSTLLNNIMIPFVVVMIVSPSCFYNVLDAAPSVNAVFTHEVCETITISSNCLQYTHISETSSYDPPFRYSYQCSSSLITYYAPAFVNLCIVSMFVMPMAHLVAVEALRRVGNNTRWSRMLNIAIPTTWKLPAIGETSDTTRTYFNPLKEQLAQLNFVALICTFGVVFPPLAVALAVTLVVCTVITKLKLGRLLQHVCDHDGGPFAQSVDQACESLLGSALLRDFVWMLSIVACLFYTLFLFDTLGDEVGFHEAYWVLIVVPLLPVCAVCAHLWLQPHSPISEDTDSTTSKERPPLEMTVLPGTGSPLNGTETFNVMLQDAEA